MCDRIVYVIKVIGKIGKDTKKTGSEINRISKQLNLNAEF